MELELRITSNAMRNCGDCLICDEFASSALAACSCSARRREGSAEAPAWCATRADIGDRCAEKTEIEEDVEANADSCDPK
jgi:hypothetical protein